MGRRVNRYSQTTRDANEPDLVRLAGRFGVAWWQGPPLDGWTLHRGVWRPAEIKTGARLGWTDEYTPAQKRFLEWAALYHGPVLTLRTDEDVISAFNARTGG